MTNKKFNIKVFKHSQEFDKSLVFAANALAGEVGEVCNVIKKIEYYKHYPSYSTRHDKEVKEGKRIANPERLIDELGDVLFYTVQTAIRAGITLDIIMKSQSKKLDKLSKEYKKVFKK